MTAAPRLPNWAGQVLAATTVIALFAGHLFGGAFALADGLILASTIAVIATAAVLATPESVWVLRDRGLWPVAGLWSAPLLVSAWQSVAAGFDREYALGALLELSGLAAGFILGAVIGVGERRLSAFRMWLCGALLLFGLAALVHFVLQVDQLVPLPVYLEIDRLAFTLGSPNSAALVFGLGLIFAVSAVLAARGRASEDRRRAVFAIAVPLGAAVIAFIDLGLTRSRSGVVLTAAAGLLVTALYVRWTPRRVLTIALPVAAFALIAMGVMVFSRLGGRSEFFGPRLVIFREHLPFALDRPLLGHGFGSFVELNRTRTSEADFATLHDIGALHNLYLQWMEQAGWIAPLAAGGAIFLVLARILSESGRGGRGSALWLRAALAAALLAFTQGLLDLGLEHYSIAETLAVTLGVGWGITVRRTEARTSPRRAAKRSTAD